MPLSGTLELDGALATAPVVGDLRPDPWELPGAEVLQVSYEVDADAALAVTPAALHPSIPSYATFSVVRYPDTPRGPCNLAQVRLIVRAGIRPRGLLLAGWCDNAEAAGALATGWGYRLAPAEVSLQRRYGRIRGTVALDGETALDVSLDDPEPVPGGDLELFDSLHLVNADGGPLIVQADPIHRIAEADRGRAVLDVFRPELLAVPGLVPVHAIVAVACRADVELAAPRFVLDPAVPAIQGTRRL